MCWKYTLKYSGVCILHSNGSGKNSYLYCTCDLSFSALRPPPPPPPPPSSTSSSLKVLILFYYLTGKLDNPPVHEGMGRLNPYPGHYQLQPHRGPFWCSSSSCGLPVWKAEGEAIYVLLGVQEDNEGLDIHYLFVDPDMALADQHSGVVDRLVQAELENLSKNSLIFWPKM